LGSNGVGHKLLILDVTVDAREVDLGADVDGLLTDDGHLEVHAVGEIVLLNVGEDSSRVDST
jgi:hypothetical protein